MACFSSYLIDRDPRGVNTLISYLLVGAATPFFPQHRKSAWKMKTIFSFFLYVNFMKKSLLATAAASTVVIPAVAQVSFSINQTIGPASELYIDLETGAFGSTAGSVPDFDVRVYFEAYEAETPAIQMSGTWDLAFQSPGYALRYSFGDTLSFGTVSNLGYLEYYGGGPWQGGTGGDVDYVAFRSAGTSRNAWMGIVYDDAGDTLTVQSFATAPDSVPLTAGAAIPEPAEAGALMALLAGSAAVYNRRRK